MLRIIGVNPHGGAVDRFSAGAGDIFSAPGVSQQRGRLGHSVADCVRKADLLEPFLDLRINRSAAHNELTYLAAERVDQAFTDLIEYDSVDSGNLRQELDHRLVQHRFDLGLEDLLHHERNGDELVRLNLLERLHKGARGRGLAQPVD